jgi:hypothetical protein
MIDISFNENPELYKDSYKCLDFLKNSTFELGKYPEEITNFHVYSEVKNEKELLCIKSFFATQNLDKCKLILWSDYEVSDNPLLSPYKKNIDFRIYSPESEFKDTRLEGNKKWAAASDQKHYMKSGALRFLAAHKYGGIWVDMDMVLLRDFQPLLDQEWAYMWGSELDFENFGPCAAMFSIKKKSRLSDLCIDEIINTDVCPDSTVLDHVLLAKVYKKHKFDVFPSVFFNTEWQMNTSFVNGERKYDPNGIGTKIESGWFKKNEYSSLLFLQAFSWHWHNSSYKNHIPEEGSKFDHLNKMTDVRLKYKGII